MVKVVPSESSPSPMPATSPTIVAVPEKTGILTQAEGLDELKGLRDTSGDPARHPTDAAEAPARVDS